MKLRDFAVQVASKLQAAGFEGLWAGGCVRDHFLGREPKDYDVATNALPDQVREVFGKNRTLAIGAAFGVITVLGPRRAVPVYRDGHLTSQTRAEQHVIEIATFRRDAEYSDGRRPDSVEYTDAKEDALRRDFTINGMFFDPVKEEVVDYVGGQQDIERKVIRAIGNPHERIQEDKLRMLRGVRFASTLGFELETETRSAIAQHASEINVVSKERIGQELIRMLDHSNRGDAVRLMWESGLLKEILPEQAKSGFDELFYSQRRVVLDRLNGEFHSACAALLGSGLDHIPTDGLWQTWRLSNDQQKNILWMHRNWKLLVAADQHPWSRIQPLLIHPAAAFALDLAVAELGVETDGVRLSRERLKLAADVLDPRPLIDGSDLQELGMQPGPGFKDILNRVRAAQLDGEVNDREAALSLAKSVVSP